MSEQVEKLIAGAVQQRGVSVSPGVVAQAEALLEDLLAAASRHPCAQTDSARDFYLPRAALDIVTGFAKREAKEARRASNREAHRLRVVTPRAGQALIPPPGAVPNNDTKWGEQDGRPDASSNRGSGR